MKAAVLVGAALCVLAALVIAYRKFWIPFADERAWRRDNVRRNEMFANQITAARKRSAAIKNGRTERNITGTPIGRKTGERSAS